MTQPQARVLVTGGAGFLGSHLCDRFIAAGHRVICLDTLMTGRLKNVEHLLGHPRFRMVEGDVMDGFDLQEPVEVILHFASPASPQDYLRHPILTLKIGATGTFHMLELAGHHEAVLALASSSEVYGDPLVNPQPESYWGHVNPVGVRSVYDEAKRYAEALTMAYHRARGLDARIARIFNTYGPRMRLSDGRAVPTFMTQALSEEPLTVYGDGSQTRSLCYVDDLVEGLYRLTFYRAAEADMPADGEETLPVFNLGNPDEVSVLQLAREVIAVTGSRSEILFEPLPPDDPRVRRPDISKARRLLGWEPRVPRREGLRRVVPYFREAVAAREGV